MRTPSAKRRRLYPRGGAKFDPAAWCLRAVQAGYRFTVLDGNDQCGIHTEEPAAQRTQVQADLKLRSECREEVPTLVFDLLGGTEAERTDNSRRVRAYLRRGSFADRYFQHGDNWYVRRGTQGTGSADQADHQKSRQAEGSA